MDERCYELGSIAEENAGTIHVGVDHSHVAVYLNGWLSADGISLNQGKAGEFARLFIAAVWEAGQQAGAAEERSKAVRS